MKSLRAELATRQSVARYVPESPLFHPEAPTLTSSLAVFSEAPEFNASLSRLGQGASCLLMGSASPANVGALRKMLAANSVPDPEILVFDRLPIPRIYAEMGVEMPDAQFLQLDASTAAETLRGRHFDLIVQDFLLNCLPPVLAPAVLHSVRELIAPQGIALISMSTDAHPSNGAAEPVASALSCWPDRWSSTAWSVADLARSEDEYDAMCAHLVGRALIDEATGHIVQVTSPSCQFEFFTPRVEMEQLFLSAGLKVTPVDISESVDYSGLACTRHRLIATLA
ncbi:MAG: hypothetical protein RIG84_13745 [Roseovarius sp.]